MGSSEQYEISWDDIITPNEYDILMAGFTGEMDNESKEFFDKTVGKFGNVFNNIVKNSAKLDFPEETARNIIQKGLTIFIKDLIGK